MVVGVLEPEAGTLTGRLNDSNSPWLKLEGEKWQSRADAV